MAQQSTEELDRRQPLFDRQVPITFRADDRDERTASLTVRVLTGSRVALGQKERLSKSFSHDSLLPTQY